MVCWCLLNELMLTVLVYFFLLADETAQPQRVIVVEDDALIGRILLPVFFEHG